MGERRWPARVWLRVIDAADLDAEALRRLVRAEMADTCVLRLRNARPTGNPLDFWRAVGEVVGTSSDVVEDSATGQLKIVPGAWEDVRFEPDRADTYRHHKVGQPLHSDGAYVPPAYLRPGDRAVLPGAPSPVRRREPVRGHVAMASAPAPEPAALPAADDPAGAFRQGRVAWSRTSILSGGMAG